MALEFAIFLALAIQSYRIYRVYTPQVLVNLVACGVILHHAPRVVETIVGAQFAFLPVVDWILANIPITLAWWFVYRAIYAGIRKSYAI
jgi:hypothetical protein